MEGLLTSAPQQLDLVALTRSAGSEAAAQLRARGVGVAEGDLDDPASLEAALQGVDMVRIRVCARACVRACV